VAIDKNKMTKKEWDSFKEKLSPSARKAIEDEESKSGKTEVVEIEKEPIEVDKADRKKEHEKVEPKTEKTHDKKAEVLETKLVHVPTAKSVSSHKPAHHTSAKPNMAMVHKTVMGGINPNTPLPYTYHGAKTKTPHGTHTQLMQIPAWVFPNFQQPAKTDHKTRYLPSDPMRPFDAPVPARLTKKEKIQQQRRARVPRNKPEYGNVILNGAGVVCNMPVWNGPNGPFPEFQKLMRRR
jgi:hypothetical protein